MDRGGKGKGGGPGPPAMALPRVLLQKILAWLPGEGEGGICSAGLVCREWQEAVREAGDSLWQEAFLNKFGPNVAFWSLIEQRKNAAPDVDANGQCWVWRRRYMERTIVGRNWKEGKCKHMHLPDEESVDIEGAVPGAGEGGGAGSSVCAVTVDNSLLVMGMFPGDVEVWDLESGKSLCILRGHTGYIHSIDVDMLGQFVMTASEDRTARVWSVATGECLAVMDHPEACAEVWWVSNHVGVHTMTVDGKKYLQVKSRPPVDDSCQERVQQSVKEVPYIITAMRLLDEDEDAEFLLWDTCSFEPQKSNPVQGTILRRYEKAYMFDQQTGVLAVAGADKHVRLHHVLSREDLVELKLSISGKIKDVFFGHSHKHGWQLIVGSDSREVVVLDIATQGLVSSFRYTAVEEMTMFSLSEHLFCLTASLQRPWLPQSTVRTAGFRVWDACKGERMGGLLELEVFGTPCDALEFDAQQPGQPNVTVVLAGADGKVTLWTLPSGEVAELPCRMSMGEHGYLVAESNWRWLAVRDHSGVHVFDFLV